MGGTMGALTPLRICTWFPPWELKDQRILIYLISMAKIMYKPLSVEPIVCSRGGQKKICVVWWTLVKTMKYFFVNFINNLLVISFLITECRHQYKNLLKGKTIWGWYHITRYSHEEESKFQLWTKPDGSLQLHSF